MKIISSLYCLFFILFALSGCRTSHGPAEKVSAIYFTNGQLKSVWVTRGGVLNGIKREYYESGNLRKATEYKDNVIDGMQNTYFESGALWKKDVFDKGELIQSVEYDEEGQIISTKTFR